MNSILGRALRVCLVSSCVASVVACTAKPLKLDTSVTIRWTSYGVPHITAESWHGLGYGQGYAFAKENICTLADQITKVRSERSRWFGPGEKNANVMSDMAYKAMEVVPHAQLFWDAQISQRAKDMLTGYAAGYNARLAEVGKDGLPSPCKGADWVQPITELDLLAYYADLGELASARNFKEYLTLAHPPNDTTQNDWPRWLDPAGQNELTLAFGTALDPLRLMQVGSNGWGLGKDKVADLPGMADVAGAVLGNPHFPWFGELRLWESHLTIPGEVDVAGASLSGVGGVLIGHNQHVAWTETVSASRKFTVYKLAIVKSDPTSYTVDGKVYKMTSHAETIQIKQADGSLKPQTQTFWKSHHGPMLVVGGVGEWTNETAFTLRDANALNGRLLDHFLGFAVAKSVGDLETVCRTVQANPWTNTMAADDHGAAFYTESHSTPNVSKATLDAWKADTDFVVGLLRQNGVVMLDGATAANDWIVKPGAREDGLTPWEETPHLTRSDFVFNANDSHWLTNPGELLEGFGGMFGAERTQRSARTRMNLTFLTGQGKDAAAGEDGKFTQDELMAMFMNDHIHTADLALPDLLTACAGVTNVVVDGKTVDVSQACEILGKWDRTATADGKGALLWREFWFDKNGPPWAHGFAVADPLGTPYGLPLAPTGTANVAVQTLARAVLTFQNAKIPLDAAAPDFEYTMKGADRLAIHGGGDEEGALQVVGWVDGENDTILPDLRMPPPQKDVSGSGLAIGDGYPINYGSSFVMVCMLTANGPRAKAILTYGQSSDPASPQFTDQATLFSQRKFRDMPFTDAEIAADPNLTTQILTLP
jgi:acyl-homoserine-lactone acylase